MCITASGCILQYENQHASWATLAHSPLPSGDDVTSTEPLRAMMGDSSVIN